MVLTQSGAKSVRKRLQIAIVSSVLPRPCGIATFSNSISRSLSHVLGREATSYIALNDGQEYQYTSRVTFEIGQESLEDYHKAAEAINDSSVDVVSLQHEYGLYGGPDGNYIVDFLSRVNKPVVTTLHTVLEKPSPGQYKTLVEVAAFSKAVVVMNRLAIKILTDVYDVPEFKIRLIPHGVADKFYLDPIYYKNKLNLTDRFVIMTFGFLSRNKGIEVAIESLPKVIEKHPNVLYIILGITHPVVKRREGEEYREYLEALVQEKGLSDNVRFENRFVDDDTLDLYLGAADVVICPYHSDAQVTSGVLSLSLGKGKTIISTPYLHAREALANGRGRLVNFRDSIGMGEVISELIENPDERRAIAGEAFIAGQAMGWEIVSHQYTDLFEDVVSKSSAGQFQQVRQGRVYTLPDINLNYLKELTDDTGIIQHTLYGIPDFKHDYSADDAGRAIVAYAQYYNLFRDESALTMVDKYLAFLLHARRDDGWFYNYMDYNRNFPEQEISEDTFGRCLWGLGAATRLVQNRAQGLLARTIVEESIPLIDQLTYTRAKAYTACGLASYLVLHPSYEPAQIALKNICDSLLHMLNENRSVDWVWFEDFLTYDNARLAQTLLLGYRHLRDVRYLKAGLNALDFLIREQYQNGFFDMIGNEGWYYRGQERALFSQQPVDAGALTETCMLAMALSGKEKYLEMGYAAFQWYLGRNRLGKPLYNSINGACSDGLEPDGASRNRGAEATISFALALVSLYRWELISRFYYRDRLTEWSELFQQD